MLKFSTCSGVRILMILLFIPAVIETRRTARNDANGSLSVIRLSEKSCCFQSTKNCLNYPLVDPVKIPCPNLSTNTENSYNLTAINVHRTGKKLASTFSDALLETVERNLRHKWSFTGYAWKKRTLCSITENNEDSDEPKKTLLDYEGPAVEQEIEDSNPLETHVRVKRGKSNFDTISSFTYEPNYIRDLANSFPRNSYDEEDDEILSVTKREVKSVLSFTNASTNQNDNSKVIESHRNYMNSEVLDDPEDPMLSVELIRRKRNDYSKVNRIDRSPEKETELSYPEDNHIIDSILSKFDRKNLIAGSDVSNADPASLANPEINRIVENDRFPKHGQIDRPHLNVESSRNRRKVPRKNVRHKKNSKSKKKKHISTKPKIQKNHSLRKKKNNEARNKGRSKMSIASRGVPKNLNSNKRLHGRSAKSKKSIDKKPERLKLKSERFSNHDVSPLHVKLSEIVQNKITDNLKSERDKRRNAFSAPQETQETFAKNQKSMASSIEGTKLRTKRDRETEANHGFQNESDELKYYEDIREPEPESVQCIDEEESPNSESDQLDATRAVRSIEEVKELAKKLVVKVNELQNYLNNDDTNRRNEREDKRIKVRAIDDLCSNVSTSCAVFKETPKIVQRCVPPMSHEFTSTSKIIVERKVDSNAGKRKRSKEKESAGKKRSTQRSGNKIPSSTSSPARRDVKKARHKWGRWTDWSSCSVTCGKGRQIRWRYCLQDCSTAETEMEEKACQLPACRPGKFLGIF